MSQQLSEGAKGGGGGGGSGLEIRQDFPDIAYWRADLVTDASGEIIFSVTLPDNLTTWRLAAKAITADTLVGETVNDVVATKDLQVRPLLPRFFTAGDRAKIGAVVINTTDQPAVDGRLTIDLSGATLDTDQTAVDFALDPGAHKAASTSRSPSMRMAATVVVTLTAQPPSPQPAPTVICPTPCA